MFNTNSKLFDQIFELKFTAKMLVKESKRCETEERLQKTKAKQAMAKGNMEGAKIHAQNAIRKKSEALNWLQLASRLDATVARLEEQSKMGNVNKTMAGIVKSLNKALKQAPLEKVTSTMETFEKQFEDLDVQSGVMNDAMNKQAALTTPPDQVHTLLQQIADDNNMDLKIGLPQAGSSQLPESEREKDDLEARLASIRGSNS